MPSSAEQKAKARGGIKAYRTVRKGDRTILVAVVPEAGPRGGHTVALGGPVAGVSKPRRLRKRQPGQKKWKARRLRRRSRVLSSQP